MSFRNRFLAEVRAASSFQVGEMHLSETHAVQEAVRELLCFFLPACSTAPLTPSHTFTFFLTVAKTEVTWEDAARGCIMQNPAPGRRGALQLAVDLESGRGPLAPPRSPHTSAHTCLSAPSHLLSPEALQAETSSLAKTSSW